MKNKLNTIFLLLLLTYSCVSQPGPKEDKTGVSDPAETESPVKVVEKEKAPREEMQKEPQAIYFRSSGIELWSAAGDYSNLLSVPYKHRDKENTRISPTAHIALSDSGADIIFNNAEEVHHPMEVSEPVEFDILNIDLGNGAFALSTPDAKRSKRYSINSIVIVDKKFIDKPYYVGTFEWNEIGNDMDMGFPEFINSLSADNQDYLDIGGAIVLPFSPITLDPSDEGLTFFFSWTDINNIETLKVKISTY